MKLKRYKKKKPIARQPLRKVTVVYTRHAVQSSVDGESLLGTRNDDIY